MALPPFLRKIGESKSMRFQCRDSQGAVDLSNTTVEIWLQIQNSENSFPFQLGVGILDDQTSPSGLGWWQYNWLPNNTTPAGIYGLEARVIFVDGSVKKFPTVGTYPIYIFESEST